MSSFNRFLLWAGCSCAVTLVASVSSMAQEQHGASGVDSASTQSWTAVNESLSLRVTDLKRTKHNTIKLRFEMRNTGPEKIDSFPGTYFSEFSHIYLRHITSRVELKPLTGGASGCLCSKPSTLQPSKSLTGWAEYPSLPPEIGEVTVAFGSDTVIDDVPIK
jgi:hypothetical protein